jgi:hypothetical protein
VAHPIVYKKTYLISNPQASHAAAVLVLVRNVSPFFIWVMECKSAMKETIRFLVYNNLKVELLNKFKMRCSCTLNASKYFAIVFFFLNRQSAKFFFIG